MVTRIKRRCGHYTEVSEEKKGWYLWALRITRCPPCDESWKQKPSCQGLCSTGPLDPANETFGEMH